MTILLHTSPSVLLNPPVWGVWLSCWTWLCGLLPSGPARCGCPGLLRSDCWQSCSVSWHWWTCWGWTDYCRHYSPFLSDLRPAPSPGDRPERAKTETARGKEREEAQRTQTDMHTNRCMLVSFSARWNAMKVANVQYLCAPNAHKSYSSTVALVRF